MRISKIRKNLQAKLRKKFFWHSKKYPCGTELKKDILNHWFYRFNKTKRKRKITMSVYMNDIYIHDEILGGPNSNSIEIHLAEYLEDAIPDRWIEGDLMIGSISFEELELIYKIAKAKRDEITTAILNGEMTSQVCEKAHRSIIRKTILKNI